MRGNPLKKDFLWFERCYFQLEFVDNNFYSLLDDDSVCLFITDCIKQDHLGHPELDKIFIKNILDLSRLILIEKIDVAEFSVFKSSRDVLYGYMLLFLLKVFSLKVKVLKFEKDGTDNLTIKDFFLDRNDFSNLFIDLLFKFFLFNEIIHKIIFMFNNNFLRVFSFRFIELCANNGFITLKDIRAQKRHYKILIFNLFHIPYISEIGLYTEKFEIYIRFGKDPYIYNKHFSSIFSILKQAKYSNATFKMPFEQVDILTYRNVYVDKNLLTTNFKLLLKASEFGESVDLLRLVDSFCLKLEKFINENDLESLKIYHAKLSEILNLIRIKTILNSDFFDKKVYLPFMFCFRGRIYDLGDLSFTFYKEFRFCMYSGFYEEEEEKFHPISSQVNSTIDNQFYFFKKYPWFGQLTLLRQRTCVWLFISLGAMKKAELGKKVHIAAFILEGLDLWENSKSVALFDDVYEKMEFNYLLFLINEIKTVKRLKKWIFWKDAPASCFQHLLVILGERDEESYKICNLNSTEYWYDPYQYLISDFFEKKKESLIRVKKFANSLLANEARFFYVFSRKRLKKVIMTETYGAGFKKLTSYFYLNLNLNEFSLNEQKEILEIWENFFDYLSNENVLFAQSSKAINDSFTRNKLLIASNPDNTEVDYSCFIIQITQNELYVNRKRHTYQTRVISTDFDRSQFNTSLRANFVQSRDALIARKYIFYTKMWTVHDCFSIDFLNITYMVSVVNELMNGEFFDLKINPKSRKTIYSIFIIL